jgi:hypothetical protein
MRMTVAAMTPEFQKLTNVPITSNTGYQAMSPTRAATLRPTAEVKLMLGEVAKYSMPLCGPAALGLVSSPSLC